MPDKNFARINAKKLNWKSYFFSFGLHISLYCQLFLYFTDCLFPGEKTFQKAEKSFVHPTIFLI